MVGSTYGYHLAQREAAVVDSQSMRLALFLSAQLASGASCWLHVSVATAIPLAHAVLVSEQTELGTHDGYADTSASSIVRNPPTDGVTQITSIVQPELISHASSNPCVAC
ncbi:uncharacterized protein TrAFT101_009921 [Trichoderma asperellum]|uniref:uncharacterized protein n=1 Tax=Trichoderma asperellum TaxID=101201 RepID=UPI00332C7462|nr:hypothetical protein TrAFT101_009921 [Trichoderma asperellum]